MSNETGIFWFGTIVGVLVLALVLALFTDTFSTTDLGPDCRILDDGAAVCLDDTAGWYFEPGTF